MAATLGLSAEAMMQEKEIPKSQEEIEEGISKMKSARNQQSHTYKTKMLEEDQPKSQEEIERDMFEHLKIKLEHKKVWNHFLKANGDLSKVSDPIAYGRIADSILEIENRK